MSCRDEGFVELSVWPPVARPPRPYTGAGTSRAREQAGSGCFDKVSKGR